MVYGEINETYLHKHHFALVGRQDKHKLHFELFLQYEHMHKLHFEEFLHNLGRL